jgi:hypothetical protein
MSDLETVIDKFSGFITKEQADYILKGETESQPKAPGEPRKANMTVKELLNSIAVKKSAENPESIVNVKDCIYRIFNPQTINIKGRESKRRVVILGEEGSTIALNLRDKLSEFIDINSFERGDTVIVNNVFLDSTTTELKSSQNTIINKISPSQLNAINDYSLVKEELRKVDVIGRILEISPIRHVTRLGKTGQIAVASCVITDSINTIDASFWGSSAITTTSLKTNDLVKMEFCDIRMRDGKMQIYVNDDSRVLASNSFASRLLGKK